MDAFLDKWYIFKSRKFWAFVGAVATVLITSSSIHPYPIQAVLMSIVALTISYIGTVAWEDTATKAAEATQTTTVTAPGASDVTVTQPDSDAGRPS